MSDTILFPTIDSSHWASVFENHRQQTPGERNPIAAQIRCRLASEVHNPRLVLMMAIQRASNDGFQYFARALKAELIRVHGGNFPQGLPPAPNLAANNGVTNSGDPAGMPARKVEAGQPAGALCSGGSGQKEAA